MPTLTYQIEMTAENAPKIDQINRIILGEAYVEPAAKKPSAETATEAATSTSSKASPTTAKAEPKSKAAPKTIETKDGPSLADFRTAAKKAKSEHGEAFAMQVLASHDVEDKGTLGRTVSAAEAHQYAGIIAAWQSGPVATGSEDDDLGDDDLDDGFDDEDDAGEVDAEAVKTALKAYSREHGRDAAKEIMAKHGVASLSKVDSTAPAKLAKLMKDLV